MVCSRLRRTSCCSASTVEVDRGSEPTSSYGSSVSREPFPSGSNSRSYERRDDLVAVLTYFIAGYIFPRADAHERRYFIAGLWIGRSFFSRGFFCYFFRAALRCGSRAELRGGSSHHRGLWTVQSYGELHHEVHAGMGVPSRLPLVPARLVRFGCSTTASAQGARLLLIVAQLLPRACCDAEVFTSSLAVPCAHVQAVI